MMGRPRRPPPDRIPRPCRWREDRGSATAETAIVLPVVVAMVVVILVTGAGMGVQVRLENAARGAARELARGEDVSAAVTDAERIGGPGTLVRVSQDGPWVLVEVTRGLRPGTGLLAGARWELSADAQARREPHLLEGSGP